MRRGEIIVYIGLILLFAGCKREPFCDIDAPERALTEAPAGFPDIPFPTDNGYTEARWKLGKKLFYDPILSVDSTISCGSCHKMEFAMADNRAFSPGVEDRPGVRNAPGLFNVAYHPYLLREGSNPTLEMQILVPIQEHNEFAHNIVLIADQLNLDSVYVSMSQEAYGRNPDAYVITRAISTFERTLISGNSRYDQWRYQDCEDALTKEEKLGKDIFFGDKGRCWQCHGGINFTSYSFENNGLYTTYTDPGRYRFTLDSADYARFKVPSLRNVALTAPYMHDGSISTLEDVISHYEAGGAGFFNQSPEIQPLSITEKEKKALIAFLESLTDPDFVNDGRFAP